MTVRNKGQSLTEYTMISLLIAVATILTLNLFSTELNASLPNLIDRIFNGGGGPLDNRIATTAAPTITTDNGTTVTGLSTIQVTTANGTVINLPNYPTDIVNAIETAGGNGTTEILLASLSKLINDLEAAGIPHKLVF